MLTRINKETWIVIFLFLLNLIFGLTFINEGMFHFDAVWLAQAVEKTYKTVNLHPVCNGRYGSVIVNSILYLPFYLLGENADFTTRFSSILFHSLSISILFIFLKSLLNDFLIALLTALLLSFTPFYFTPNTYGKEHGMALFFLLFSFYLLLRAVNKKSLILTGLSAFIFIFAVTIRESIIVTAPVFILLYLNPSLSFKPARIAFPKNRLNWKLTICLFASLSIAFSVPFFTYLKYIFFKTLFIKDISQDTGVVSFLGLLSPIFKLAINDMLISIPNIIFLFSLAGIIITLKKESFPHIFFLYLLSLLFYFGNTSGYCSRHLDLVIIPVYVFASYALAELCRRYKKIRILVIFLLIFVVSRMFIFMHPMLKFRHNYNGEKQFALFVKEKTPENSLIIAMDDGIFIEYYGKRKAIGHPVGNLEKINTFIAQLKANIKNDIPVYLIESGLSYDPGDIFKNALFDSFKIGMIGEKLTDDYHHPELRFQTYHQKLFKIESKI